MANLLIPRREIWTQQPNQSVSIVWPNGITPIAAYNAANGFVDCSGAAMTRGSAANVGAGKAGLSVKQTAVNTSAYRPIVGLPSVLASYMAVWSGDFVGAFSGVTPKICGISNTATSQSADLIGIERGSTADHIQIIGKTGASGVIRDINVGASAWYGKKVTLVFVNAIPDATFRLWACVDGVVSEYSSIYSGSSAPTILGTERLVIGADIIETASRYANVNSAVAAFACGAITTNYARSVAQNPWQIFAPRETRLFVPIGGGGAVNATASGAFPSVSLSANTAGASGSASASGPLAAITLSAPTATASAGGSATASGSFAALSISPATATATATKSATASGAFAVVRLSAPTATATGTTAGGANATGTPAQITISHATAIAIGSAVASGGFQSIGITAPTGTASVGNGNATATGAWSSVSITAPTGYASSGFIRAPAGSGPTVIQPGGYRPSQSATSRPSNTGGRRY